MSRFLFWFSARLPCRFINDKGRDYLERYYLLTVCGWRFYLHRFVGSDPAHGLHDHPWRRAFSVLLSGFYYEQTRYGVRVVRWFNMLSGDTFHRVLLPRTGPLHLTVDESTAEIVGATREEIPCWTLFAHKVGDVKPWGFLEDMREDCGAMLFIPYQYKVEGGKNSEWWKTAPTRAEILDKRNGSF